MLDGIIQPDICNKCDTTLGNNNFINFWECHHLICENCLISYFNNNLNMKSDIKLNIKCPIEGCNRFAYFYNDDQMIKIIKKSKNKMLKRQVKIIKEQIWSEVSFKESFKFQKFHDYIKDIKSFLSIDNRCFESRCLNVFQKSISYFFYAIFLSLPVYFLYCMIGYHMQIKGVYEDLYQNIFLFVLMAFQLFSSLLLIALIVFPCLYIYYFYLIAYIIYENFG